MIYSLHHSIHTHGVNHGNCARPELTRSCNHVPLLALTGREENLPLDCFLCLHTTNLAGPALAEAEERPPPAHAEEWVEPIIGKMRSV